MLDDIYIVGTSNKGKIRIERFNDPECAMKHAIGTFTHNVRKIPTAGITARVYVHVENCAPLGYADSEGWNKQ